MLKRRIAAVLFVPFAGAALAQSPPPPGEPARATLNPSSAPSAPSTAQDPLSLIAALAMAGERNPALRSARSDADASAGALMQASARPNPTLSFLQEGFAAQERTTTGQLSHTLELGGKLRARLDVASYGREAALASLDERAATLRADVVRAFYGLLAAQRQLKVAQQSTAIAARSADMADKRARAGKVSPVEATKARVAESGARIELANAAAQVATAAEQLANVTGNPAVAGRTAAGDLDAIPDVAPLAQLRQRLDDAPQSRTARAGMLRANAQISLEKARRIPDLTVTAGMKHVVAGGSPDNQAVVGVSIPLPLFDTNRGAILEATHKAEAARASFDSERARIDLDLSQAFTRYQRAADEARQLKSDVLPAARQSLDAMARGYELGKFALLDVIDAQRTLYQAESRYVQVLADTHQAYADIGRLVGEPLDPAAPLR
ncbi:RND transporter [Burkholderia stagnalis]|uniref:TolC family protein n=1 Tax=Burkholderia stagnalis TaxID=1503054 RepID=UPI00075DE25F|nr:TolC family protein [Burkholderia stagnalis]KVD91038.1 RND transporter [Burkholderia stagnalis]